MDWKTTFYVLFNILFALVLIALLAVAVLTVVEYFEHSSHPVSGGEKIP